MKVLITGADGFIAQNLIKRLRQDEHHEVLTFDRSNTIDDLFSLTNNADIVFHLAGVNRPKNENEFFLGNTQLTEDLCNALSDTKRKIPLIFSSSTQAILDNPYGQSKLSAEEVIHTYGKTTRSKVFIYRLTNVFGKWSRPNYNSVVSTFCYNIANDLPICVDDPDKPLSLVYIDDVVGEFLRIIDNKADKSAEINPVYDIKLGELAELIKSFDENRAQSLVGGVGQGLTRALYATYLSYFETSKFSYKLDLHIDERGGFSEFLKTKHSGQVSFFTINPGHIRGGHYHHTKNEKFLVIKGSAKFRFRNILTNEKYEKDVKDDLLEVVETIPGWVHDISNSSDEVTIVMLWANEIFDKDQPDTYTSSLD
tara:strand:+ start:1302 stop:2405 length:1104 start_codon:yes stop_codon:yes gene_type:complete